MKTKKKIITKAIGIFVILLFTSFVMNAQQRGQERMHRQHPPIPDSTQIVKIIDDLTKELSLSEEQKLKITHLFNNHFSEVRTKMKVEKQKREKHKQEMDDHRKKFEASVNALLTSEQQKKFKEHRKKHQNKEGKRPNHGRK